MSVANRHQLLRQRMQDLEIDAFLSSSPANRRYLSGFSGSAGSVLLTAGEALIFTDSRYVEQAGSQCPGFKVIQYKHIYPSLNEQAKALRLRRVGFEAHHVTVRWLEEARENIPWVQWVGTCDLVEDLRIVKDETEIQAITSAQEVADRVFSELLSIIRPGIEERELATEFQYRVSRMGGENMAIGPVVASGWRSALPHGRPTDKIIERGDFLTLDLGVLIDGYRSDMTRTVVVGRASDLQREIYQLVLESERAGVKAVRAGRPASHVDAVARQIIAESEHANHVFQYGVGHGVGLDVHERPFMRDDSPDTLKPGMVVTVEPGIYVPGWGGVRVEDLVVVTGDQARVISLSPTELLEI